MDKLEEYLERARHERDMHERNGATGIVEAIDRIFPELKEDTGEKIKKRIMAFLDNIANGRPQSNPSATQCNDWILWLASQQTAEWSENDESSRQDAIYFIEQFQKSDKCKDEGDMQNSVTCVNWLQSLRPQNQWKPTEQQLYDMEYIMTHYPNIKGMVESIYNELKKL